MFSPPRDTNVEPPRTPRLPGQIQVVKPLAHFLRCRPRARFSTKSSSEASHTCDSDREALRSLVNRVFIVDDHALIRRSYAEEVEDTDGFTMCGTAASFAEALEALPATRPDVVLVDLSLDRDAPGGAELIRRLTASMANEAMTDASATDASAEEPPADPPAPVPRWLVVSAYDNEAIVERVRDAGAHGFLSKRDAGDGLRAALRDVTESTGTFLRYPASAPE